MHSCISRPFVFWDGRLGNFFCEMGTDLARKLIYGRTKGTYRFRPHDVESLRHRQRDPVMAVDRHIYGEVNSKTGMKRVFTEIRRDVEAAGSRPALTELYKRAGYLITLTHAPSWHEKFGQDAKALQKVGDDEFRKTARKINHKAAQIGTQADYDDRWGKKS
jgi:hypothetical protein